MNIIEDIIEGNKNLHIIEGNKNLLKLAGMLEARSELGKRIDLKGYDQNQFFHPCGSPGCAAGMWFFMNIKHPTYSYSTSSLKLDFSLSNNELEELFSSYGCNKAQDEFAAAAYIRAFVARRGGVPSEEPQPSAITTSA
jgi:hypothetical protein